MKRRLFLFIATFATLALHATTDSLRVSIFGDSYSTFEGYIPPTHEPWYAPEGSRFAKDQNDVRRVEETWWWQVVQTIARIIAKGHMAGGIYNCGAPCTCTTYDLYCQLAARHGLAPARILPDDSWSRSLAMDTSKLEAVL